MEVAIEAATIVATWLTTLIISVLVATNDISWYINSDVARPLMAEANCSFSTLECIHKAKTYGLTLIEENEDRYWLKIREEEDQANAMRRAREAYDKSIADAFSKASKYDIMVRNPPVCSTVDVHQYNCYTNHVTNTNYVIAECTTPPAQPPSPPVIAGVPIQRLSIGDEGVRYGSTADGVFQFIMLFIAVSYLCFSLFCCCWRCMSPRPRPVQRIERVVTPGGLH
jgi:hypothetical protein